MVLVGVHPVLTQVPPRWPRSTSATFRPASANATGRSLPPQLVPMTIASYWAANGIPMFSFSPLPGDAVCSEAACVRIVDELASAYERRASAAVGTHVLSKRMRRGLQVRHQERRFAYR